jgi:hypothetical protein
MDLFNRLGFTEKRVDISFDFFQKKQKEELLNINIDTDSEHKGLVPCDVAKIPKDYNEKTFPYVTLPMLHTAFFFKGLVRRALSYILPTDTSREGTRAILAEAERERQLINIVRLQRQITIFQRMLVKSVRKNRDILIGEVGKYTTENMIIAYALKDHFTEVGYSNVTVTSSEDSIYLQIDIFY